MTVESAQRYVLRPADESDVDWLVMLRKQTMTPHFAAAGERLSEEQHRRRVLDNFDSIRLITVNGMAVGMLKVVRDVEHWRIVQLQLLADRQRSGIGTAVIRDLQTEASQHGVPVTLSVLKVNPAHRLYARLGFIVDKATDDAYRMRFEPEPPA